VIVRVTTLGAADGNAAGAVNAVVRYLDGRATAPGGIHPSSLPELPTPDGTTGIVGYYADSVDGPGRWLGRGITGMRLNGEVHPEEFRRVLLGQHAVTGEQLVGARGSAVRAEAAGREEAAAAAHGEPDELLTLAQAATQLGVSDRYLRRVAAETAARRSEQAAAIAAGQPPPELPTTYLTASHDGDGKHWRVARGEVERFALERKVPAAVVGYDLTFSAPKSVSILWARADAAGQAQILTAIDKAVAVGMDYIQEQAAWVGRGKHHRVAQGLVAADYVHATSRSLDPQLHHHVVVANMAESPAGNVMALDGRPFFAHAKTAGYLAAAELRHELASTMGVEWEEVERGLADVAGVSEAAIAEMSKRSNEIDEYAEQVGLDSVAARQVATFATRAAKDHAVDPEALRPAWKRRLDEAGFDARAVAACYGRQAAPLLVTEDDRDKLFRRLGGERGVTEMASTFDRRDVLQFVAEWSGDRLDAAQIADLADEWIATEAVVTLHAANREGRTADVIRLADGRAVSSVAGEALYTTRQVLEVEQRLFAGYERGRHAGAAVVPEATVEAVLALRTRLDDEQAAMVRAITRSGHRVQCVLGPAGSGKTTALEAAVAAWCDAGFTPLGTAVQGTHAEVLGNRTGVEARTVASLLMAVAKGTVTIDARTVVLVDESSTLGNRDLLALTEAVESGGGALRLIGDPAQHTAVAAGGAWRRLLEDYAADRAEVATLHRQQGEDMADVRLALTDYREDRVAAAIDRLRAGGRVVETDSPEEVIDALVADWYHDRQRRLADPTLAVSTMTADHHLERRELNHRARALLIADGTLKGPSLDLPGISFRAGDEVIATQGDFRLRARGAGAKDHVRTGERGRVVEVRLGKVRRDSALVVDFERRGRVVVDHGHLTHRVRPGVIGRLAHSYALTTYAAQGETYEAGRGLATEAAMRAGVYVALSRGRTDAKLYVLRRRELLPAADEHLDLPRLEATTAILAEVTARLQAQQAEQLATEVDADAPEVARLRRSYSLGQLSAMASGPATPESHRARRALVDELGAIATRARVRPDPALVARLGPRPDGGEHRRVWDAAVGEVATFRARWAAVPITGGPAASWALGPQRAGRAGEDYATAAALLRRAEAAAKALQPTAELARQRRRLLDVLATSVGTTSPAPSLAPDAAGAADALAAAVMAHRLAQGRLERAETARGRRRNPQSIELATRDVAAAELRVARAQSRLDEAVHAQAALAGDADGCHDAAERLATVDAALVLQADRAVDVQAAYLAAALGARPESSQGRASWDAGARAIERYRHVQLGLSPDVASPAPAGDGLLRAIGVRPHGGAAATAYGDARAAIRRARAELLLAEIAAEAPETPYSSSPADRLAARRLPSLLDELERTRASAARRAVAERRAVAARAAVDEARAGIDEASNVPTGPGRRWRRSSSRVSVDAEILARAQRRLHQAQTAAAAADAALAATPAVPAHHVTTLEEAVVLRGRNVTADALRHPPPWLCADVAARVAANPLGHDDVDPERLARGYGCLATYAERSGLHGAECIDDILAPDPASDALVRHRMAVIDDLVPGMGAAVDAGLDLGL
jgi:conjugative relaxase-like TrwC/TraI family protein